MSTVSFSPTLTPCSRLTMVRLTVDQLDDLCVLSASGTAALLKLPDAPDAHAPPSGGGAELDLSLIHI